LSIGTPKLTFIANQCRVRCEFSREQVLSYPDGAEDIINRARAKMKSERDAGRVEFYRVFASRLREMWQRLASSPEDISTVVAVTVCAGSPHLRGFHFAPLEDEVDGIIGHLTINANKATVESWQHYFVKLCIGKAIRDAELDHVPDPAEIHRLWLMAVSGQRITNHPIRSIKAHTHHAHSKYPFEFHEDTAHNDITLIVHDVLKMRLQNNWDAMFAQLRSFEVKQKSNGKKVELGLDTIVRTLRSAQRGPERYGINLPVVILAGYIPPAGLSRAKIAAAKTEVELDFTGSELQHTASAKKQANASPTKTAKPAEKVAPLSFAISPDGMEGRISHFSMELYRRSSGAIHAAEILKSADDAGITFGITEDLVDSLKIALASKDNLTGFVIAKGMTPTAGKDGEVAIGSPSDAETTDIRERGLRGFTRSGQVCAYISYKSPAVDGRTVDNKSIPAPRPVPEGVTAGEGCELKGHVFIAKYDGMVKVDNNRIFIEKGLIHKGDINLSSGNIHFTGNVEINGNVDSGALVEVQGDLIVTGSVSGELRVHGNVTVKGGIIGTRPNFVKVSGDLNAQFIENSCIKVKGNINIGKSVVASDIYCENTVTVIDKAGHIVGGKIYAEQKLVTANLGAVSGVPAEVYVGCGSAGEYSYHLKKRRIHNLLLTHERTEKELETLKARPPQTLTPRHKEEMTEIESYLKRVSAVLKKQEFAAENAKDRIHHNREATLEVSETLQANVRITVAGKRFHYKDAVASVSIAVRSGTAKAEPLVAAGKDSEVKKTG
jgi:uncharacterized protein (DUF342 family)